MVFKASFHNHSVYGRERSIYIRAIKATPTKLVENALKYGINGLAVTDVNSDLFFQNLLDKQLRFFDNRYGVEILEGGNVASVTDDETGKEVYIYNGIEFHETAEEEIADHIIIVGHQGSLMKEFKKLNLEERLYLARETRGIVIAPHPTVALGLREENLRKYTAMGLIDATEFNSQARVSGKANPLQSLIELFFKYREQNETARQLAQELGLPFIAGPDSNTGNLSLAYNIFAEGPQGEQMKNGIKHIKFLKGQINQKTFTRHEGYISAVDFLIDYGLEIGLLYPIRKAFKLRKFFWEK